MTIAANPVKARLMTEDRSLKLLASELLSYETTGVRDGEKWTGRSTFFDYATGTFPAGFVDNLSASLIGAGHMTRVARKSAPAPLGPPLMDAYLAVHPFGYDPRYDYQIETVRRLERHRGIVAMLATGGGKSLVARTVAKRFAMPTIFITTRKILMHQMADGFREAGFEVGFMGDGAWSPKSGVNVAMVQTLSARIRDERVRKLMQLFQVAILEEAHEVSGQEYYDVMSTLVNAHYRLALTATPFMRPDEEANMRLMAVSGQVAIRVSEKVLIDRGILAKPYFKYLDTPPPKNLERGAGWQRAYTRGIVENPVRNAAFVSEFVRARDHGLSVMALVQRRKHGDTLREMCEAAGLRVDYIFGDHDGDRRARALRRLKEGAIDVLIGSTILDVGVDVPAVGMIALVGGGKAEVALRQRVGRGLRAKKSGPNICLIVDCLDRGHRILLEHSRERRSIIKATGGFGENIIAKGGDFDWSVFKISA